MLVSVQNVGYLPNIHTLCRTLHPAVIEADGAIKSQLKEKTGQTSVPQVFVKGNFIGGCNDGGVLLSDCVPHVKPCPEARCLGLTTCQ